MRKCTHGPRQLGSSSALFLLAPASAWLQSPSHQLSLSRLTTPFLGLFFTLPGAPSPFAERKAPRTQPTTTPAATERASGSKEKGKETERKKNKRRGTTGEEKQKKARQGYSSGDRERDQGQGSEPEARRARKVRSRFPSTSTLSRLQGQQRETSQPGALAAPRAYVRVVIAMSSPAGGGYGGGAGSGAEPAHHHGHAHGHLLLQHHYAHHVAAAAAAAAGGQMYHVPQHSRREKLRFPPDGAAASDSPATQQLAPQQHGAPGAWPPPAFYSYASSSSSYSPHSPTTLPQQTVPSNGLTAAPQQLPQIPAQQNFSLSLSSASSNPPATPRRQPQQQLAGARGPAAPAAATGPYGPFTGYATVLGRSRFLDPAQKLLEEICDVGGAGAHVDRSVPGEDLLDADPVDVEDHDVVGHELDAATDRDAGSMSGAEQHWKKTRLISMMEEVSER